MGLTSHSCTSAGLSRINGQWGSQGGHVLTTTVRRGFVAAAVVVAVDQLTKTAATAVGNTWVTRPANNPEFSLGAAGGPLPMMVLATVIAVIAFNAYVVAQTARGRLPVWIPGLLIGGALSNLIDRLFLGAVRDFIPTSGVIWNLADLAVLVGIGGYAWCHLQRRQPTSEGGET